MLERLAALEDEFVAVEAELADPAVLADPDRLRRAAKRHKDLGAIVSRYREYQSRRDDLEAAREMLADATGEDRDAMRLEAAEAEADLERLEDELRELLLPRDPNDEKNVIVEIRGAEGGEEANLFARDLFAMYEGFAGRMGWKLEVLGADPSDMGGYNEVTFLLKGDNVWSRMKHEGGPHRVQRVPVTESQGRVHT
ncbi:MAG TPA: PCRF domain-containing protein, partial [Acidimicrobiales bacterium]|nr:PCRF domain-containing protein [Acidimicrobiales bacterium]